MYTEEKCLYLSVYFWAEAANFHTMFRQTEPLNVAIFPILKTKRYCSSTREKVMSISVELLSNSTAADKFGLVFIITYIESIYIYCTYIANPEKSWQLVVTDSLKQWR